MKKSAILIPAAIIALAVVSVSIPSCGNRRGAAQEAQDSVEVIDTVIPEVEPLVANDTLTDLARLFAGMPLDSGSVFFAKTQTAAWKNYSASMQTTWDRCQKNLSKVDTLSQNDLADINAKIKTVFYPFSGPDFIYPNTLFPDADEYILAGLEPVGKYLDVANATAEKYQKYSFALRNILYSSFFVTKNMAVDLSNAEADGVLPCMAILMARMDMQIISVEDVDICEGFRVTFFKKGSNHKQALTFLSTNISDYAFDPKVKEYFEGIDSTTTVNYTKSASYLMHRDYFSQIRNIILNHSCATVQDDTGVPYRFFDKSQWEFTFYGQYERPIKLFDEYTYQLDLVDAWAAQGAKKLPFRMGYGKGASMIVARRK